VVEANFLIEKKAGGGVVQSSFYGVSKKGGGVSKTFEKITRDTTFISQRWKRKTRRTLGEKKGNLHYILAPLEKEKGKKGGGREVSPSFIGIQSAL